MNNPPVHASLFSGIGGFDLAAEWLGFRNAFHCEINPFCEKILKYHFPDAEHYTDITKTDFTPWRGKIDILSGGFPCQPFSLAGQRKGAEDDRYLWPQMLRAIREIRPAWVVGENVAGILTMVQPGKEVEVGRSTSLFGEDYTDEEMHRQYVVETVCTDLEREGYSVRPFVIPACAVGAPHRRDRVWFVAHRTDAGSETLQCGGDNGIHAIKTYAHTNSDRCRWWTDKQKPHSECVGTTDYRYGGKNGPVTHPYEYRSAAQEKGGGTERGRRRNIPQPEERRNPPQRADGLLGLPGTAAHAQSTGIERKYEQRSGEVQSVGRNSEAVQSRWGKFPTQSPVCSRDDGFPIPMDGITFSKWRQESIKAYGNAIVPQLAYEIFNAIQETINK